MGGRRGHREGAGHAGAPRAPDRKPTPPLGPPGDLHRAHQEPPLQLLGAPLRERLAVLHRRCPAAEACARRGRDLGGPRRLPPPPAYNTPRNIAHRTVYDTSSILAVRSGGAGAGPPSAPSPRPLAPPPG